MLYRNFIVLFDFPTFNPFAIYPMRLNGASV